jgi:hypothetical protein
MLSKSKRFNGAGRIDIVRARVGHMPRHMIPTCPNASCVVSLAMREEPCLACQVVFDRQ